MPAIKNYKADLKGKYRRYIEISLILSLSLIIAAFNFFPQGRTDPNNQFQTQELITIENVLNTIQKPKPPPPKPPQIIEASPEDMPEDIELIDVQIDKNAKLTPPPPPVRPATNYNDEPFYEFPEELPKPVSGLKALQENAYYTEIARRAGIEGTVYIVAKIDKEGNVIDARVKIGIGGGLDEVALNAVKLTKFHPGKQRGKPVKVKMVIPIRFALR